MGRIAPEIWQNVCSFLSGSDLISVAQCNAMFRDCAEVSSMGTARVSHN